MMHTSNKKIDLVESYGDILEGTVDRLQASNVDSSTKDAWKTTDYASITAHAAKGEIGSQQGRWRLKTDRRGHRNRIHIQMAQELA